jgi:hypothetical protein
MGLRWRNGFVVLVLLDMGLRWRIERAYGALAGHIFPLLDGRLFSIKGAHFQVKLHSYIGRYRVRKNSAEIQNDNNKQNYKWYC